MGMSVCVCVCVSVCVSTGAAGLDPQSVLAAAQQGGAVSGADMASLLVDMEKRLKAMEGGAGVSVYTV